MNSKERGYIFQDIFSAYVISKKVNEILKGIKTYTKVVLDKKANTTDKFDDLKIIEGDNSKEIQIKYSEVKDKLDLADLKNPSSDYNIYQYIISKKNSSISNNYLIIRNCLGEINENLGDKLIFSEEHGFFDNSKIYKIKNEPQIVKEFYDNRIIRGNNKKQPYEQITEDDIKVFFENFKIEITNIKLEDNTFKQLIIENFEDGIFICSDIKKEVFLEALLNRMRLYRAEDEYVEKSIVDITNEVIKILQLDKYITPVNNYLEVDESEEIYREKDINNVIQILEENKMLYIYGTPGVGKSWFSKQLKEKIEKNAIISTYYFYFNRNDIERKKRLTKINFLTTINHQLQNIHGFNINLFNMDINNIIEKINSSEEMHYIIFDGIDHILREETEEKIIVKELIIKLKGIIENTEKLKIILLSQPIEDIDVECRYELKNFCEEETKNLTEKLCSKYNVDNEEINFIDIHKKTNGNPLLINYLLKDYIRDGSIPEKDFQNIDEYYDYIFNGEQFYLYTYFGILPFPIKAEELSQIAKVNLEDVVNEIRLIKNTLVENNEGEYIVFHESLKNYILKNKRKLLQDLTDNLIDWLNSLDIYENEKAFNFLPELIVNNEKYCVFNKEYNLEKIIECIIEKGMSVAEVRKFNNICYKIFSKKKDFKQIYYIEHFSDILKTYEYEIDLDVFEDYIKILYIKGKIKLLEKVIYRRGIIEYSNDNQQWEYICEICKYLLSNNVKLEYKDIVNIYFQNSKRKDLIKFDKIIIPKNEIGFMIRYIKCYFYKKEKILGDIRKQNEELAKLLSSILEENYEGLNLRLARCGIIIKDRDIDIQKIDNNFKSEKYISKFNDNVLNYFLQNKFTEEQIETLIYSWDSVNSNIPKFYKLIIEFVKLLINDKASVEEYYKMFDRYHYNELEFEGNIIYQEKELDFLGNLICKNIYKNDIIKFFIDFINKIESEKGSRGHEGIVPFLRGIYNTILNNVKRNNIKLEEDTVDLLKIRLDSGDSNASNLRYIMTNHIIASLAGYKNEDDFEYIKQLMFSYGSYRDIQIWELSDIFDRLLAEKEMNNQRILELYTVAYNAVKRMDRAKDVWHIPNELLEKYAEKVSADKAMKILFNTLISNKDGIREDDQLFSYIYEKLARKDFKRNEFLYNYWKYISGSIEYGIITKESYLKKVLTLANKKEYEYIKNEVVQHIKSNESSVNIKNIEEAFKNKINIINYEEKRDNPCKSNKANLTINNINELITRINENYISCSDISFESIINIINELNDEDEIIKNILDIKQFSSINRIFKTLKDNSFEFHKYDTNIMITFLVGIYYRGNSNVSNMGDDEIYEECIKLDPINSKRILEKYFEMDNDYEIGNKSGKIFKYLVPKKDIISIFDNIINLYNKRLPGMERIISQFRYDLGDKNDILLNYFMIKVVQNEKHRRISTIDELILTNLLQVKKEKNIFYIDATTICNSLNIIELYLTDLYLMKQSFLNWNNINNINIVEYKMNENRTEILRNIERCGKNVSSNLIENFRGLLAMDKYNVYCYKANMIQIYSDYGGVEDRNLKKRMFYISKLNKVQELFVKKKINKEMKRIRILKNMYFSIVLLERYINHEDKCN